MWTAALHLAPSRNVVDFAREQVGRASTGLLFTVVISFDIENGAPAHSLPEPAFIALQRGNTHSPACRRAVNAISSMVLAPMTSCHAGPSDRLLAHAPRDDDGDSGGTPDDAA